MTAPGLDAGDVRLVEMGSLEVARPPDVLEIRGLGSCVAIGLTDPVHRVAALAHTVIPRPLDRGGRGPAWATAESVPHLVDALRRAGADPANLVADLAGGASMFASTLKGFNVGDANVRAAEAALAGAGIPIRVRDVGGYASRAVRLDPTTGAFEVQAREPRSERVPPDPARHPDAALRDWQAFATLLLHRAISPLSTLTGDAVNLESPEAFELTENELVDFLGGTGTPIRGGFVTLTCGQWTGHLAVLLPEAHASRLGNAIRNLSEAPVSEDEVLAEVLNIVTSHAVSALAGIVQERILPEAPRTIRGTVRHILREVESRSAAGERVLTLHGRAYAEGLFHGADVALLILGSPGWLEARS